MANEKKKRTLEEKVEAITQEMFRDLGLDTNDIKRFNSLKESVQKRLEEDAMSVAVEKLWRGKI